MARIALTGVAGIIAALVAVWWFGLSGAGISALLVLVFCLSSAYAIRALFSRFLIARRPRQERGKKCDGVE